MTNLIAQANQKFKISSCLVVNWTFDYFETLRQIPVFELAIFKAIKSSAPSLSREISILDGILAIIRMQQVSSSNEFQHDEGFRFESNQRIVAALNPCQRSLACF